jgi:DNA-binding response OmpR family regulator
MKDKVKVLYVEDEPSLAELLRAGLAMFGMVVSPIYCSAEELFGKVSSPDFAAADVLILDIRLPGVTGLELAKRLREKGEKRPILIVSAYNRPDSAVLAEIGAAFQPKPFDFDEIVHTIQALVKPG